MLALREKRVEVDAAEDRAQRRLGDLHGRGMNVLDLGHASLCSITR